VTDVIGLWSWRHLQRWMRGVSRFRSAVTEAGSVGRCRPLGALLDNDTKFRTVIGRTKISWFSL